jgi:hypothetical protein
MLAQLGSYSTEPKLSSLSTMSFASFYKTQEFYSWLIAAKYHQADKSMVSAAFAAMDSVCTTWWNQLHMDRRIDPANCKTLFFSAVWLTYQANYKIQEIIEYWDKMTVVAPTT